MLNTYINLIGIMFLTWFIWLPLLLFITLATPRKLLDKYFKEPHFNKGELIIFGSFPGFLMRTSVFCRFFLTPKVVKGRNLEGFVEDTPKWYKVSVLATVLGAALHFLFVFVSMSIIYFFDLQKV